MRGRIRLAAPVLALVTIGAACGTTTSPSEAPSSSVEVVDPSAVQGLWYLSRAESAERWVTGDARSEFTVTISDGQVVADGVCNQLVAGITFDGSRVSVTNGGRTEAGCPREELDHAMEEVFFTALGMSSVVEQADDGALVLVGDGSRIELAREHQRG